MSTDAVDSLTLNRKGSPADLCRRLGWLPGTRLVGDEGFGPTVIEITAVGEEKILAKTLSHNGTPSTRGENSWVLRCRDWRVLECAPASPIDEDLDG